MEFLLNPFPYVFARVNGELAGVREGQKHETPRPTTRDPFSPSLSSQRLCKRYFQAVHSLFLPLGGIAERTAGL